MTPTTNPESKTMATCNSGRACTLCCKLLGITTLAKPRYQWCRFCKKDTGCAVYEQRPDECQVYTCLWLETQLRGEGMIDELKPVNCGVILDTSATDKQSLVAHVNDGADWRKGAIGTLIKTLSMQATILIREKDRVTIVRNNRICGSDVCFSGEEMGIATYNVTPIPEAQRPVAVP